jgi:hypothetical protein
VNTRRTRRGRVDALATSNPWRSSVMKFWLHAVLALLVFAGVLNGVGIGNTAEANPTTYDFEIGPSSSKTTDPIYDASDCEGIAQHFVENPIPLNALDVANGEEIVGWEIACPIDVVASGGDMNGPGSSRIIPRRFGFIRVKYAQ